MSATKHLSSTGWIRHEGEKLTTGAGRLGSWRLSASMEYCQLLPAEKSVTETYIGAALEQQSSDLASEVDG